MPRKRKRRPVDGRPKFVLDWERFDELVEAHCTAVGIAAILGTTIDILSARLSDEKGLTFTEYAQSKRQGGVSNIFVTQYRQAKKGNTEMLKLLGKEWGGQGKESADTAPSEAVLRPFLEQLMQFQGKITTTFEPRQITESVDEDTE